MTHQKKNTKKKQKPKEKTGNTKTINGEKKTDKK